MRPFGLRAASILAAGALAVTAAPAVADTHPLRPRTHFVMAPDGSSGSRVAGAGIPNIDSVKSTIRTYYNATDGIADKHHSAYITEMRGIERRWMRWLVRHAPQKDGRAAPKAIVFDADDTTLWTYDMEDGAMKFVFDPVLQDTWVQQQLFPATPGMVRFVNRAQTLGYTIFGITGRNSGQEEATVANLAKVGYRPFDGANFYTKWRSSETKPDYVTCVDPAKCTTVEYKAGTRKHIESLGYKIVLNVGDQWSDLQGGYSTHTLKLPNPTYYLPSADLPGVSEPQLAPRTRFTMKPDGSSGRRPDGEGIPNIDSVKSTVRTYYKATDGIADKTSSPYITELTAFVQRHTEQLASVCSRLVDRGQRPAIVLDTDDTTLWTYDLEDGVLKFVFDPAVQDTWVQDQLFPATPGMVSLVDAVHDAGCTIVGITGRTSAQEAASVANLRKVGYEGFTRRLYFTKRPSQAGLSTVQYKAGTRRHVERLGYRIVANLGDQFSDLRGGHADRVYKLPNPTYYLP